MTARPIIKRHALRSQSAKSTDRRYVDIDYLADRSETLAAQTTPRLAVGERGESTTYFASLLPRVCCCSCYCTPGGKRGLLEGQAQGAARLPSGDERPHLPPRGQVPRVEERLDAGE